MSGALLRPSGEVIERPRRGGFRMWALAVLVGVVVGLLVVVVRTLIAYGEFMFFGATDSRLPARLAALPWYARMIPPVIGGVAVALILRLGVSLGWGPSPRPFGLADVVAARRLRGSLRASTLALRDSFLSIAVTIVSLSSGASAGREESAVHLGGSVAILPGRLFGLDLAVRRLLLCFGAAAAIGAALHAPIAGLFLARELLLPRQRLAGLGPVALAAISGWLAAYWAFGGRPVIGVPEIGAIPMAFLVAAPVVAAPLTLVAWCARFVWTHGPGSVEKLAVSRSIPVWTLPAIGGVGLALLALVFPQVLGVGYASLSMGLGGGYGALLMLALGLAKLAATTLTLSFRFGGGPLAPALYVGAMAGSALGVAIGVATGEAAAGQVFFGLLGMGVLVAVLLDAPIVAAILVFELSGAPEAGGVYAGLRVSRDVHGPAAVGFGRGLARPPAASLALGPDRPYRCAG